MKSTKILILALGLMALTATAFAQGPDPEVTPFTATGGAPRIIATNSDTGEVATVILTSLRGDEEDPAWLPGSPDPQQVKESIYYTFTHPISALSDIYINMLLPGPNADLVSPFTGYNQWRMINNGSEDIARARVGLDSPQAAYYIVQIQFLEDTSFYEGSTIELSGVRVNLSGASPGGEEVFVDFTTAEGSAVITNNHILVARSTDPLECEDCEPAISFVGDGASIQDIATLTITELFHNAFEAPARLQIHVYDIPTGFEFVGLSGWDETGDVDASPAGCSSLPTTTSATCYIQITDQNPGIIESLYVGLQFDLVGTPEFTPNNAKVRITLYPPYTTDPPYGYPANISSYLRYSPLYIYCDVLFSIEPEWGGRLLSVYNVTDGETWDTGIAIMNGSGSMPLNPDWDLQHWYDIPQTGAIKVYMYPQYTPDPDPFDPYGYGDSAAPGRAYIFTTSSSARPGIGLDQFGRLPWNGTWTVLTSELCGNAMLDTNADGVGDGALCTADWPAFQGFIVFETYFPDAEGVNFIADWVGDNTMSHGYPMINLWGKQLFRDHLSFIVDWITR